VDGCPSSLVGGREVVGLSVLSSKLVIRESDSESQSELVLKLEWELEVVGEVGVCATNGDFESVMMETTNRVDNN